ncbi:14376_t:CDS:2, partial [Ambispora leptoticha]
NKKPVEEVREISTYQPKYTDEEVAKLKEIFIAEQKEAIKKYQIKGESYGPGNGQSNLSDDEKKGLVVVGVGGAVALTILTGGVAAPIAVKGAEAVINYANSQGGGESSSSSNMHMGSGSVGSRKTEVSKTSSPIWQGLKPFHGGIRTNGLSGSKRSYFTWDYTHNHIEKYNHL